MSKQEYETMFDLASQLSDEEIVLLIGALHHRIEVFVGLLGGKCISGELNPDNPACLNGGVQLNMKLAELGDIREDPWIAGAVEADRKEATE
jgi:hypothetical protein